MKTDATSQSPSLCSGVIGTSFSTCPDRVSNNVPTILLLPGMDTPQPARVVGSTLVACASAGLPAHRLLVSTLTRSADDAARLPYPLALRVEVPARSARDRKPVRARRNAWLDRRCSELMTSALRWADDHATFDRNGHATNLVGRLMEVQIALPLLYLYHASHAQREHERFLRLLTDETITTIVGASFGGSVAVDNLIRAVREGSIPKTRRLRLLTLGTNLGTILTNSPLYRQLRDARGLIQVPENVSWTHFYSPTDVFVGASARPRHFVGVEECEVDTGPLLGWPLTKPHAMARYLETEEVQRALRASLIGDPRE